MLVIWGQLFAFNTIATLLALIPSQFFLRKSNHIYKDTLIEPPTPCVFCFIVWNLFVFDYFSSRFSDYSLKSIFWYIKLQNIHDFSRCQNKSKFITVLIWSFPFEYRNFNHAFSLLFHHQRCLCLVFVYRWVRYILSYSNVFTNYVCMVLFACSIRQFARLSTQIFIPSKALVSLWVKL